jgi:hypothetical protein
MTAEDVKLCSFSWCFTTSHNHSTTTKQQGSRRQENSRIVLFHQYNIREILGCLFALLLVLVAVQLQFSCSLTFLSYSAILFPGLVTN